MRPSLVTAVLLVAASSCKAEPPRDRGPEPMRVRGGDATLPSPVGDPSDPSDPSEASETGGTADARTSDNELPAPVVLPERPRADPAIERALDLINGSGLRFIDRPTDSDPDADTEADPDAKPSEYTAEQFATLLRTKWDWVGYDITELEPWLDEIATSSFKTRVPYQVVHADGTTGELRVWLDLQLRASAAKDGEP